MARGDKVFKKLAAMMNTDYNIERNEPYLPKHEADLRPRCTWSVDPHDGWAAHPLVVTPLGDGCNGCWGCRRKDAPGAAYSCAPLLS